MKKINWRWNGGSWNGNRAVSGLNWPLKFCSMVMLVYLCNAVQSAKSVLPDVKNILTNSITEIDEFENLTRVCLNLCTL